MKYLFFSHLGASTFHLGTQVEIMKHILSDQNNQLVILECNAGLTGCNFNPTQNPLACAMCQGRYQQLYADLDLSRIEFISLKKNKLVIEDNLVFNSFEELKQLQYKGITIGRGIASSLISLYREYDLTKIERVQEVIASYIRSSRHLVDTYIDILDQSQIDQVYIYNGRLAEVNPVVDLCSKREIPYVTFEIGADTTRYQLFENSNVHSIREKSRIFKEIQDTIPQEDILEKGNEWFEIRKNGAQKNYNFSKFQEKGKLPDDFDDAKMNITIFNSSEDEFKVIQEWETDLFRDQNEIIRRIVEAFEMDDQIHFYLRVHPNLLNLRNTQTTGIKAMNYKNLTVIPSDDPISTYTLIQHSDKVITFGSTVGIEASYLKIPAIVYGHSFYENMAVTHNPDSFEKLLELIRNNELAPVENPLGAAVYAYYSRYAGVKFEFFNYSDKNHARFNDIPIKRMSGKTIPFLVKYLFQPKLIRKWKLMHYLLVNRKLSYKNLFFVYADSVNNPFAN